MTHLYLLLKSAHLIAMVAWFAGLFYLPRLFVYHSTCSEVSGYSRFCTMERKLFRFIMTPAWLATLIFGSGLLLLQPFWLRQGWLHIKLSLIFVLSIYHLYCGQLVRAFAASRNQHSERYYRWFNEVPSLLLVAIVLLAVFRPF